MTPGLRYSVKGTKGTLSLSFSHGISLASFLSLMSSSTGSFLKYEVDVQEGQLKGSVSAPSSDSYGVDPESAWGTLETTSEPSNTAVGEKIKSASFLSCAHFLGPKQLLIASAVTTDTRASLAPTRPSMRLSERRSEGKASLLSRLRNRST